MNVKHGVEHGVERAGVEQRCLGPNERDGSKFGSEAAAVAPRAAVAVLHAGLDSVACAVVHEYRCKRCARGDQIVFGLGLGIRLGTLFGTRIRIGHRRHASGIGGGRETRARND